MTQDWLTADLIAQLIQAPVFLVFVVYVVYNNKIWRDYLRERNSKLEKCLDHLNETLKKMDTTHDKQNKMMLRYLERHGGAAIDIETLMSNEI